MYVKVIGCLGNELGSRGEIYAFTAPMKVILLTISDYRLQKKRMTIIVMLCFGTTAANTLQHEDNLHYFIWIRKRIEKSIVIMRLLLVTFDTDLPETCTKPQTPCAQTSSGDTS